MYKPNLHMHNKLFHISVLLFASLNTQAQVIPLKSGDVPGLTIISSDLYTDDAFRSYSGSDANLYLEYGFRSLLVQRLKMNADELKIEVFEMTSPEAAYGIYSVSVIKCMFRDTVAPFDCQGRFQYQAAIGPYYVSISRSTDKQVTGTGMMSVARAFMTKNHTAPFRLPDAFNQGRIRASGQMVYFAKGLLGLQHCPFPWGNEIIGINFSMYSIMIPDQWGDIYFARFSFLRPEDLTRFLNAMGLMSYNMPVPSRFNEGIFREYQTTSDPLTIYFMQSQQTISIRQILNY